MESFNVVSDFSSYFFEKLETDSSSNKTSFSFPLVISLTILSRKVVILYVKLSEVFYIH